MATVPYTAEYGIVDNSNAWDGDAITVGVGDQIRPLSPGFIYSVGRTYQENPELLGTVGMEQDDLSTVEPANGTIPLNLRYESAVNRLIAYHFGVDTTSDIDEGTVTVGTQHLITYDDTLVGDFLTLAARYDAGILEVPSFKPGALTFSWSSGERPTMEVETFARQILEPGETQQNGTSELDALTLTGTGGGIVLDSQLTVRLNAQSGAALGSSDVLAVRSLTANYSRDLGEADPTSDTVPYRIEPVPGGNGYSASLELTLADFDDFTHWQQHRDGTLVKAEVEWEGSVISGAASNNYQIVLRFPQAQLTTGDPTPGQRFGQTLSLKGTTAGSTPSGMDDTDPHVLIRNGESAAYIS